MYTRYSNGTNNCRRCGNTSTIKTETYNLGDKDSNDKKLGDMW